MAADLTGFIIIQEKCNKVLANYLDKDVTFAYNGANQFHFLPVYRMDGKKARGKCRKSKNADE